MITIRSAKTPDEINACLKIRADVFIREQKVPVDRERDAYDGSAYHFIVLESDQPVGTARVLLKDNGQSAKIQRIAISQSKRGSGIGKLLIAAIEKATELQHVHHFMLEAQTHALPFYERLGYMAYGDEFMDAGIPHLRMKKKNASKTSL